MIVGKKTGDRGAFGSPCDQFSCLEETPKPVELPSFCAGSSRVQSSLNIYMSKP